MGVVLFDKGLGPLPSAPLSISPYVTMNSAFSYWKTQDGSEPPRSLETNNFFLRPSESGDSWPTQDGAIQRPGKEVTDNFFLIFLFMCMCQQRLEESLSFLGSGVTGGCEGSSVGAGNRTVWSSEKARILHP